MLERTEIAVLKAILILSTNCYAPIFYVFVKYNFQLVLKFCFFPSPTYYNTYHVSISDFYVSLAVIYITELQFSLMIGKNNV